jgi:NAD(P)-dependent dehydrogenase (short-subunit alcohol dehydrogenase family)
MEKRNTLNYVIVLGGSGGIGSAICSQLKFSGYLPIICYKKNQKKALEIAKTTGGIAINIDLKNQKSILNALLKIKEKIGQNNIKGIVHGASPPPELVNFGRITPKQLNHQFQTNVVGPHTFITQIIKNYLSPNKHGFIIGILSNAIGSQNDLPQAGMGPYVISKIALQGMLLLCKSEYSWLKIETISPGFTKTKMLDIFDSRFIDSLEKTNKISSADEIASQVIEKIFL